MKIFAYFSFILLAACGTTTQVFQVENDRKVFVPTGSQVPVKIKNWNELSDSVRENISPEILASVSYQYENDRREIPPQSVVYFLKSPSTANLKLIENRGLSLLKDPRFGKTDFMKLKNKKKIIVSTYRHQLPLSETSGNGTKTISSLSRETLYATSEAESRLVVSVSYRPEAQDEKQIALDFIENVLFSKLNSAENLSKVSK